MAKIRKFIKGIYQYANLFKISNPTESVGDNEVKQVVPYRGIIQNQGDFITAEDHNEIQKNGVLFVKAEYSENFGTGVDAYVIKDYYNEQNLFDGLKLKFQIPKTNLYAAPVLIIEGLQYNLKIINNNIVENTRKGELNKNEIISVIYFDGNFILENSRAGEESYGITRYGITTDTALEGKRLAEIIGLEFGGNIQDAGAKVTGKFYYDKALKYYYECIVNNSLTYNDGSKFRAISNKPILDKVENLFKVEKLSMTHLEGFFSVQNVTEWYVPLPSHIKKEKIISVTNLNLGSWTEYNNLDFGSNCIRVGCYGNHSSVNPSEIKVLVAYFT